MTTVAGWESLAVATIKPNLVPKGVLDSPLLEIKMSKLNMHHISGKKFCEINISSEKRFSNLCSTDLIQTVWKYLRRNWFFKGVQVNALQVYFADVYGSCRNRYTTQLKLLWPKPRRDMYLSGSNIHGIVSQKSIVKTLLIIFFLVKTEWPKVFPHISSAY